MQHRKKINKKQSRKHFSRNADKTHKFNVEKPRSYAQRGGIRL
jgi:hypothetical protein